MKLHALSGESGHLANSTCWATDLFSLLTLCKYHRAQHENKDIVMKSGSVAAAACLLLCGANGMYSKQSPVLQVDGRSYENLIARSNHTSIVEFYAPWCGHCKNLQPAYEKAAKSLTGLAKVAAIDCDEEANKPFCGSMGVKGFPTLKIVRPGKKPGRPMVEDYNGGRTAKAIVDAVIDKIPNHVKRLKNADFEVWAAEGNSPKAVLFSDKGTVSALLKSVAIDFLGALSVGQVRDKETELVSKFGVEKYPTLILLPGSGQEPMTYDGELKKEAITKFLSQAASPNPDPAPSKKKSKTTKSKASSSKPASKSKAATPPAECPAGKGKAGSQTDETIVEDPTDSPSPEIKDQQKPIKVPEVAPPITQLSDGLSLEQKCLNDKAGTCVLALLPEESTPSEQTIEAIRSLSDLHQKHESAKRNLFPFYQLPASNSQAGALRTKLELSPNEVQIIAINGKREWWRQFTSTGFKLTTIENWVDAIRMGDAPKSKLPSGLVVDAEQLPAEPVKIEKGSAEYEQMKESMKGKLPEGMDFEMEEIDDETYEKIMSQGDAAKEAEHDEL